MLATRTLTPEQCEELSETLTEQLRANGGVSSAQRRVLAAHLEVSERTLARYVAEIAGGIGVQLLAGNTARDPEMGGLDALLNRKRFSFAEEELQTILFAYAGNLAALHRDAVAVAAQQQLPGPISYEQLTRKLRKELTEDQLGLIRDGIAGFKKAALYVRWSAAHRNEVWQIDATQLDAWILPRGTSTPVRPWLLCIVDDHSRVLLAASLLLHDYTAQDSAACLRRAMALRTVTLPDGREILVGGKPEKVLCDNAQQFTGQTLSQVAMQAAFVMWTVAVYAGEQKGKVERVIRAVNEDFARRLPGYTNRNVKTASMRDALKAAETQLLDEQQALDELGKFVEQWNHSPHPGDPGRSRYEVWADDDHELEEAAEALLLDTTRPLPRSSYLYHADGFRVQQDKVRRYYVDPELRVRVRGTYQLRHEPGVTEWVDAYTLDGELVARCIDSSLLDEADRDRIVQHRYDTYRELRSRRSEAVELRSLAAGEVADSDERPNPIATAHQQRAGTAAADLVAASLESPSDPGNDEVEDVAAVEAPADTQPQAGGGTAQEDAA